MEILRASHLCKTYGKGENEVRALDDVSFSIEKGEFVAIIMVHAISDNSLTFR